DVIYNTFIQKHFKEIEKKCNDDILNYLLIPDRGPRKYNVDTFAYIIEHGSNTLPFIEKWISWIKQGRFDGGEKDNEGSEILYLKFNHISPSKQELFQPIIKAAHDHVYYLLKLSLTETDINKGLYHLIGMLHGKYKHAEEIKSEVLSRIYFDGYTNEQQLLFYKIEEGFNALIDLLQVPEEKQLQSNLQSVIFELYDLDNITGFWWK
ncbi:MAG: hypothetical protein ABI772_14275, partial [Bacteroidota bacterium]